MTPPFFRSGNLAKLQRRYAMLRRTDGSLQATATKVDDRTLGIFAHHLRFQQLASVSVLTMLLLVTPTLDNWRAVLVIAALKCLTLGHNQIYILRLQSQLRSKVHDPRTRNHVTLGVGMSAFLWGCLSWPLKIGINLDFMSFLVVTIVLFSICLSVLTAGFYYKAMISAAIGGTISLGVKVAWLTPTIGPLLPVGMAIFICTTFAYGLVIERHTHGGVLMELRARRASENLARVNAELEQVLAQTQLLANRDSLTQLRNRRAFENDLIAFTKRFSHRTYCLLLLDIDHFKTINDQFGHHTGDGVLLAISTALEQWESDVPGRLCGRWGGEEFIALVALRKGENIAVIAEKLRQRVQDLSEHLHWPEPISVTTSIGCAPMASHCDFSDALRKADEMLYCAKEAGRNRWRLAA